MGVSKLTGRTKEQLEEMRETFDPKNGDTFDERYCLAKIPRQPPEYDGPQRFCVNMDTREVGSKQICKYHGGEGHGNPENLEVLAAMKSGMHAAQDNLRKDFTEKDEALYEWVVEQYPESYGIDIEEDPVSAYDIHRLGVEIVRAERGRGQILREGEVKETKVYGDDGVIIDENGEIVTEKSEHYLAQMMHRQDKKITDIEKELGITRKERLKRDDTQDATEAVKTFAELGAAFLGREDKDYDPDNEPWKDESD